MSDILTKIVARKRAIVAERKRAKPLEALQREFSARPPRDFAAALRAPGLAVIAEFKRRSPSKGDIATRCDLRAIVHGYHAAGAAALSILTDEDFFGGKDEDLRIARGAVGLPALRKDFTIDPYQVFEARAIGADAVLLIAACLDDAQLRDLHALAGELRLAALVEVHDAHELDRAIAAGARIIGVNNRDLRTFQVSLETSLRLRPLIPAGCITVAESGIRTGDDTRRLAEAGFDAILVGESLLTSARPDLKLIELASGGGAPGASTPVRSHTNIKICGLTNVDDARAAVEAGAHRIGLVLAESPRRVTAAQSLDIVRAVRHESDVIGVFRDQPPDFVNPLIDLAALDDGVQLHGDEPPEWCSRYNVAVIRRIKVTSDDTTQTLAAKIEPYRPHALPLAFGEPMTTRTRLTGDRILAFLLDPGAGSGQTFDWNIARGLPHRFYISGGLTPDNVGAAVRLLRPYGVDVSSGVELSPGRKDHVKMRDFVQAVREADASGA